VLRNGDIVDVLTQAGHEPSKDWLAIVKTSRARNKIKHIINERARARHRDRPEVSGKGSAASGRAAGRIQKNDLERVAGEYG
jgi:GTP diphosphokinase / guanosine-3',5'-bis(diphosphate) 3'-diphosphatase